MLLHITVSSGRSANNNGSSCPQNERFSLHPCFFLPRAAELWGETPQIWLLPAVLAEGDDSLAATAYRDGSAACQSGEVAAEPAIASEK